LRIQFFTDDFVDVGGAYIKVYCISKRASELEGVCVANSVFFLGLQLSLQVFKHAFIVHNRHIGAYLIGFCRVVDIHLDNLFIVFEVRTADAANIIASARIPLVIAHHEWEVCDIPFKVSEQHLIKTLKHLAIV
jgi:uncharacterized protein (UPF0212 family)